MNLKAFHYFDNLFIFMERESDRYVEVERETERERGRGRREREVCLNFIKKNCAERVAYMWR